MREEQLRKLFDSMSVEEKSYELLQVMGKCLDKDVINTYVGSENLKKTYSDEELMMAGSTLNVVNVKNIYKLQKEHVENHPKHIPMLFMGDIVIGFSTILPIGLAQGASFNPELVQQAARNVAKESAVSGVNITFSPMMDLVRDPRWGRVMESAGEDPYLNSLMCAAMVKGYQGDGIENEGTIGACIKHFAGYGAAEGGRDYDNCEISENSLRNYYLPGYKGGVDAGAKMIMTSYNTIGGVPTSTNRWLLTDILRDEWGFDGCVITDLYSATETMTHGACATREEVAEKLFAAGVDIEMGSKSCLLLKKLVEEGKVSMETVDRAAWNVLKLKNDFGLFENPYRFMDLEKAQEICYCDEHRAVAKELGIQSSVLLKNDAEILPITEKSGKVAFMGYYFDHGDVCGNWVVTDRKLNDKSLHQFLEEKAPSGDFVFAGGCPMLGRENPAEVKRYGYADEENRERMIAEAVEIAKAADTVVLAMGEISRQSGEDHSRGNITVPDVQMEMFRRICEVNENIVVVLYAGRPLVITELAEKAKAILNVWFLGSEANDAISDMLLGIAAPSGHVSMSFPYSVAQIPIYYNKLRGGKAAEPHYDDVPLQPLYPFGHGLTYTSFRYGEVWLENNTMRRGETLKVSVDVTNVGERDGYEVAQLYLRDRYADISRPMKELKGFKKVMIPAGETVTVTFDIDESMLKYYNSRMHYACDNGEFWVYIGKDSAVSEYKVFNLID